MNDKEYRRFIEQLCWSLEFAVGKSESYALKNQARAILMQQLEIIEAYKNTTPQTKPLSDEEIANTWAKHTNIAGTYDVKDIIFPFARAIEERHGIK